MFDKNHVNIIKSQNSNYKIIKRFTGGMSNYTYKIFDSFKKEYFVFRIKGENGEKFVDYNIEKTNLELVETLNINSKTILTIPNKGIRIGEYVPGKEITTPNLENISFLLKNLHNSNIIFPNDYNHLTRLEKYESYHLQKFDLYSTLKTKWILIFEKHLIQHLKYPCHNDAQKSNFIAGNDGKYYLLDWEFSGTNDFIYDIASFGNQNFNEAVELLEVYYPNPSTLFLIRLYGWRFFQCLQWYNVALAKHELGLSEKLNVPFDKVALKYLNNAKSLNEDIQTYLVKQNSIEKEEK